MPTIPDLGIIPLRKEVGHGTNPFKGAGSAYGSRHKTSRTELARTEVVVRLLVSIGLKPDQPPPDFDAVYVYALVQYGVGKAAHVLELFRQPEIRAAFRRSFDANDPELLESEADKFLEWNRLGDQLRAKGIDPRREFALFTAAFNEVADATRNPSDVRRDQQIGAILDRLAQIPDLTEIRCQINLLRVASESRQFALTPSGSRLKVFISSRMKELRDLRATVNNTLRNRGFDPFLYESVAGARPETIEQASLSEVEATDIYLGVFEETYGEITIDEFKHARTLNKPCFVYLRDKNASREPRLQRFLEKEVLEPRSAVAYSFFDNAEELAERAADEIMSWLVREHRIKSAQLRDTGTSREEQQQLQREINRLQRLVRDALPEGSALDLLAANLEIWFRVSGYPLERYEVRDSDHCERIIDVPERQGQPTRVLVYAVEGAAELVT